MRGSQGRARPDGPDAERLRRSSRSVGVAVAAASAVVVLAEVAALIWGVNLHARHEALERGARAPLRARPHGGSDLVVGRDDVVALILVIGLASIVALGLVAWWTSRRAVAPLAEALRLQRNFVADASHELRTPLTVLSTRVQVLQRRLERGQPVGDVAQHLRADADSMRQVLDDLLLTAEGAEAEPAAPVPVGPAVRAAAESLAPLAQARGIRVVVAAEPVGLGAVDVPDVALKRCVVALVDNAIQHAPDGTRIHVACEALDGEVAIRVRDHGGGIRGIAPGRVFERFAHAGARPGGRRGFGLGLALVREVARRFGGDARVEATGPEGTTMLVVLPRSR